MGVKELWRLVAGCERTLPREELHGKVVAVDASIWIQQAVRGVRAKQQSNGRRANGNAELDATHLGVIYRRLVRLMEMGAKLVFVFDGRAPAVKEKVLERRRRRKLLGLAYARQAVSKLRAANDAVGLSKLETPENSPDEPDDVSTESGAESDVSLGSFGAGVAEVEAGAVTQLPYKAQRKVIRNVYEGVVEDRLMRSEEILAATTDATTPNDFSAAQMSHFLQHTALRMKATSLRETVGNEFKRSLVGGDNTLADGVDPVNLRRVRGEENRYYYIGPKTSRDSAPDARKFLPVNPRAKGGDEGSPPPAAPPSELEQSELEQAILLSLQTGAAGGGSPDHASSESPPTGNSPGFASVADNEARLSALAPPALADLSRIPVVKRKVDVVAEAGDALAVKRARLDLAVGQRRGTAPTTPPADAAEGCGARPPAAGGGEAAAAGGGGAGSGGGFFAEEAAAAEGAGECGYGGFFMEGDGEADGGCSQGEGAPGDAGDAFLCAGGFFAEEGRGGDADVGPDAHAPSVEQAVGGTPAGHLPDAAALEGPTSPPAAGPPEEAEDEDEDEDKDEDAPSDVDVGLEAPGVVSDAVPAPALVLPSAPGAGTAPPAAAVEAAESSEDEWESVEGWAEVQADPAPPAPVASMQPPEPVDSAQLPDTDDARDAQPSAADPPASVPLCAEDEAAVVVDNPPTPAAVAAGSAASGGEQNTPVPVLQEAAEETPPPPQRDAGRSPTSADSDGMKYLTLQQAMDMQRKRLDVMRQSGANAADDIVQEMQQLLDMFGIPYITSPTEADSQLGYLSAAGLVDYIATEDSDVLLFGAKAVVRGLCGGRKTKTGTAQTSIVTCEAIKERLGYERQDLIALAMLVGADYTEGLRNVGMNAAQHLLLAAQRGVPRGGGEEAYVMAVLKNIAGVMEASRARQAEQEAAKKEREEAKRRKEEAKGGKASEDVIDVDADDAAAGADKDGPSRPSAAGKAARREKIPLRAEDHSPFLEDRVADHALKVFETRKGLHAIDPFFPNDNVLAAYARPAVDTDSTAFEWGTPMWEALVDYGVEKVDMEPANVEKMVTSLRYKVLFSSHAPLVPMSLCLAPKLTPLEQVTRSLLALRDGTATFTDRAYLERYLAGKPHIPSTVKPEAMHRDDTPRLFAVARAMNNYRREREARLLLSAGRVSLAPPPPAATPAPAPPQGGAGGGFF